jgi:outer membrane lipoprotein SlyB
MSGKWVLGLAVPVLLAGGLSACTGSSGAVQPGVVNTSSSASTYRGETGRVVSIREVNVRGSRGSGMNDGTMIGGGVGAVGGAIAGGAISNSVGGAVVGGLLGAVAGGIAGTAIDQNSGRRGIEVTLQRDDGQRVTVAQADDGDIQMGDRAMIVYDRNGVAKVVRDTGYRRD